MQYSVSALLLSADFPYFGSSTYILGKHTVISFEQKNKLFSVNERQVLLWFSLVGVYC